ncbi:MAG: hypothetical protein BroJett039_04510 [Chloroflexota bacterium]|nr:MAG: hypothetical protein BroJett039_04510 [Chloroflexota bacterium]
MPKKIYVPGAIVEAVYGYEQTNIDYYVITKRSGQFVTLQAIGKKNIKELPDALRGTCEPDPDNVLDEKPIRRKVHVNARGEESGIAIKSYGWASLWDGRPSVWTEYA